MSRNRRKLFDEIHDDLVDTVLILAGEDAGCHLEESRVRRTIQTQIIAPVVGKAFAEGRLRGRNRDEVEEEIYSAMNQAGHWSKAIDAAQDEEPLAVSARMTSYLRTCASRELQALTRGPYQAVSDAVRTAQNVLKIPMRKHRSPTGFKKPAMDRYGRDGCKLVNDEALASIAADLSFPPPAGSRKYVQQAVPKPKQVEAVVADLFDQRPDLNITHGQLVRLMMTGFNVESTNVIVNIEEIVETNIVDNNNDDDGAHPLALPEISGSENVPAWMRAFDDDLQSWLKKRDEERTDPPSHSDVFFLFYIWSTVLKNKMRPGGEYRPVDFCQWLGLDGRAPSAVSEKRSDITSTLSRLAGEHDVQDRAALRAIFVMWRRKYRDRIANFSDYLDLDEIDRIEYTPVRGR